jgi:hypothetical protein
MNETEKLGASSIVDVSALYFQWRLYLIVTVITVIKKLFLYLVAGPYLGYIFYHKNGRSGSVYDVKEELLLLKF